MAQDRKSTRSDDGDISFPRDKELCRDEKLLKEVRRTARKLDRAFRDQFTRSNDQIDYWDCYDCVLGPKQSYSGNSRIFVPIVHEAIKARVTRFVNQIFPRSQRNIECISSDEKPYAMIALLEHYIRRAKLRTQMAPALCRTGDIEGQYNIYVSWDKIDRHVAYRAPPAIDIGGMNVPDIAAGDPDDDDVVEETIERAGPAVEVLSDCDVVVLPHTADSVDEALSKGGSVGIIRRWSEDRIETAIDDGEIDEREGENLLKDMHEGMRNPGQSNIDQHHVDAAGILTGDRDSKSVTLYEIWRYLKVGDERRLCRAYYAGGAGEQVLSIKQNPYWNDRCPLLSAPVEKVANVFKGISQVMPCTQLQYAANDAVNEGMDSAAYALLPIVMTDPVKNPRVGSMVMNLAAIWQTSPADTQFAKFPPLWQDAFQIVQAAKSEIFQVLSVSPAAIAQSTGGKTKRNQAEIAAERQVDILSTADVVTNIEDEILTPLLRWFVDLDYQFRTKEISVRQYGQIGQRAMMQKVPPIQADHRYEFRWFGVDAARNEAQMQMQIAAMNVLRGIPPEMYEGYKINVVPVITHLVENTFGPRIAPEVFQSIRDQLTVDAETENEFLAEGMSFPVHVLDDDKQHMQEHARLMQTGDPTGVIREHMMLHRMQMAKKLQAQAAQMASMQRPPMGGPQGGPPGGPPGARGGPSGGQPRQGAVSGPPRGGQGPPGMIHRDRLQGVAPRR